MSETCDLEGMSREASKRAAKEEAERIFRRFEQTKEALLGKIGHEAYFCLKGVRAEEDGSLGFSVRRRDLLGMLGLRRWLAVSSWPVMRVRRADDWWINGRDVEDTETFLRAVEELR